MQSQAREKYTDEACVLAIARGDEQALATLFDRYSRILFSLINRILVDREEAEDVVQELFLQVWRTASSFDAQRGRAFTWLVTLARSRAIDRLRSPAVRNRLKSEPAEEAASREVGQDNLETYQLVEQRQIVRDALAQLSPEQRETLLLAYFEGLSQSEIADRTSTPLGTVKTRIRSSLSRLREILGDMPNALN